MKMLENVARTDMMGVDNTITIKAISTKSYPGTSTTPSNEIKATGHRIFENRFNLLHLLILDGSFLSIRYAISHTNR